MKYISIISIILFIGCGTIKETTTTETLPQTIPAVIVHDTTKVLTTLPINSTQADSIGRWYLENYCKGTENIDQNGFLGIPDYYFRTSSYSNDIMAERYTFKRPTDHYHTVGLSAEGYVNHHWTIVEFLTKRMMYPDRYNEKFNAHSDYDYFCAIRPNFPEDLDLDSASTYGELEPLFKSWGQPYKHLFYGPNGDAPVVDL